MYQCFSAPFIFAKPSPFAPGSQLTPGFAKDTNTKYQNASVYALPTFLASSLAESAEALK